MTLKKLLEDVRDFLQPMCLCRPRESCSYCRPNYERDSLADRVNAELEQLNRENQK